MDAEQNLDMEVRILTVDVIESLRISAMKQYGFGTDEMKKTKVCTFCGTKLTADTKKCTECGREVPKQTLFDVYKEHHVYCKRCDIVLAENTHFCPQCGHKVDKRIQSHSDRKQDKYIIIKITVFDRKT